MILLDTSGLLAALDASQKAHMACAAALRSARPPFLLSPFVLAELDYLLATRVGTTAELLLLEQVELGAYQLEPFSATDVARARAVILRYAALEVGLADASIVVLSERHRIRDVLTLDQRHFGALRTIDGRRFRMRPGPGV
jgi:predicted nucleic acid-binding protein